MALEAYDESAAAPGTFTVDDGTKENARIVGVFLIKLGFDVTTLTDDPATWTTPVSAGDVIIINPVTGSWPEGSENTIPGIGRTQTEYSSTSFDIPFRHKLVGPNLAFYNNLNGQKNYGAGFVFADNKALIPLRGTVGDSEAEPTPIPDSFSVLPMDFFARINADGEDLEGDRMIMCNARYRSRFLPYEVAVPESIFPL